MQLIKPLSEPLTKCLDALSVHSTCAVIGFDLPPGHLQVLSLVHLVDQRMGLPGLRWIEPVGQSPRPLMFGAFAQGTVHLNSLNSLTRRFIPTVIIRRLPRATPLADRSVMRLSSHFRYHAAVRLLTQYHLPLRFSLIGSLIAVPPASYLSSPEVTRCSSVPCHPQTPWCGGANEKRLRLHSAGSTSPHLWPTGSSSGQPRSITARYFFSCPPDPASRRAPCPPMI